MKVKHPLDILLIQPEQGKFVYKRIFYPGVEIPLNLLYLAAYLQGEGITNQILDMRVTKDTQDILQHRLTELQPKVVGISACTTEIENASKVAQVVKETLGNIPVILGGHHASAIPEETLQEYSTIDYIICGEGEVALTHFMKHLVNNEDVFHVKSLVYRDQGVIRQNPREELIKDLDSLAFPQRDTMDWNRYIPSPGTGNYMRLPSTGILSSRGCPYNCHYCSKGVFHQTIRFRSPENVVQEIEECISKYGIHDFRFYDDILTYQKWDLPRFCERILQKNLDITWNCYSRVNNITLEKLQMMKKAGCYHIKYGIEFGTEKALLLANKQATLDQALEAVRLTKMSGIECKGNFILGIPGETVVDCQQTIRFAKELSPDLVSFYPHDLFPGTHFYSQMKQKNSPLVALPRDVTEELASKAYLSFYFRPSYMLQRAKRIVKKPKREIQLIRNGIYMMSKFYLKSGWCSLSSKVSVKPSKAF